MKNKNKIILPFLLLLVPLFGLVLFLNFTLNPKPTTESEAKHRRPIFKFERMNSTLNKDLARFSFAYSEKKPDRFYIHMSTSRYMGNPVFFAEATASPPIYVYNPLLKWNKYKCGATLYWTAGAKIGNQTFYSLAQRAKVVC